MCVSMKYYPLVLDLKTNKKKVLFTCPIEVKDKNQISKLSLNKDFNFSINTLNQHYERFIKLIKCPCGKCYECKKVKALDWTNRLILESKNYKDNEVFFITLTYNNDNLPSVMQISKKEVSSFIKKLRTYLNRQNKNSNFRFFACGEYGSRTLRPHYHLIIFGLDLPDLKLFNQSGNYMTYQSNLLEHVWNKGNIYIGSVTPQSIAYVARYNIKKLHDNSNEFILMSRKPALGSNQIEKLIKSNNFYFYFKGKQNPLPSSLLQLYKRKNLYVDVIDNFISTCDINNIDALNQRIINSLAFTDFKCYNDYTSKLKKASAKGAC